MHTYYMYAYDLGKEKSGFLEDGEEAGAEGCDEGGGRFFGGAGVKGGLGVVFDAELESLGGGGAGDFGGEGEGHVDPSGDAS